MARDDRKAITTLSNYLKSKRCARCWAFNKITHAYIGGRACCDSCAAKEIKAGVTLIKLPE